ncbi:hypothetical protein VaNZ11_015497, partial [Volvox africanus]
YHPSWVPYTTSWYRDRSSLGRLVKSSAEIVQAFSSLSVVTAQATLTAQRAQATQAALLQMDIDHDLPPADIPLDMETLPEELSAAIFAAATTVSTPQTLRSGTPAQSLRSIANQ